MNAKQILAASLLSMSGCATLGGAGPRPVTQHTSALAPPGHEHGQPAKLAAGPMDLVQVMFEPADASAKATVWVSRDPSCPPAGTRALAHVTRFTGWYGDQSLAASEYLCAEMESGDAPGALHWWTQPAGP